MRARTRHRRTRPTRRAGSALAALAAVILTVSMTGCGSEDSGDSGDASPTVSESSPAPSGPSSEPGGVARRWRFVPEAGGLKPVDVRMTYPRTGRLPRCQRAGGRRCPRGGVRPCPARGRLEPVPKDTCCDRQEYTVLVTYADGTTETFRTLDGLQQPAVFEDLLGMLG